MMDIVDIEFSELMTEQVLAEFKNAFSLATGSEVEFY